MIGDTKMANSEEGSKRYRQEIINERYRAKMKEQNSILGLTPDSKHLPTVKECESCEYRDKCQGGKYCLTAAAARKRAEEQKAKPKCYRLLNKESAMKFAVRTLDPAKTPVIVAYLSPTVEEILFDSKETAQAAARQLNRDKTVVAEYGKWKVVEVEER